MSSAVTAALLGALAAGLLQTIVGIFDRKREAEAVLVAIASEVDALCRLVRHQGYLPMISRSVDEIRKGTWDGRGIIIDIRSNYFSVFEALSPKLGQLESQNAAQIVKFYAYCKAVIDGTRPDGPLTSDADLEFVADNLVNLEITLSSALRIGDAIVQLPKKKLVSELPDD